LTYVQRYVIVFFQSCLWRGEEDIVRQLRINQGITAKEVRLIGETGEQLGIVPLPRALEIARERDLDLVEVAPNVVPPVCRLLDYGKFRYQQAKKEQEARKRQKTAALREVRLRPRISDHDLDRKARLVRKFIDGGDKVRVLVFFRGREVTHPEIGLDLLKRMFRSLKEVAVIEKPPTLDGSSMTAILAPAKQAMEKGTAKENLSA